MRRAILAADLFCGAGGTSTGLLRAATRAGVGVKLLAVNHWNVAIETHSANHPDAHHLCESLDNVDPRKLVPGGRLNLLVASPECTHHSNARGGRPCSDQSRASAWHIVRWAEALYIDNILIENVREWESWGPLGTNGRPLKSRRGETFQAFLTALESLNYTVDYRVLNAANYGAPTTRERLFVMARRRPKKITWPEPTHGATADRQPELFGHRLPWRAAREIIDWSIPGQSIFERKRPLAPATIERIAAGLRKFGGHAAEPFLVMLYGTGKARSINEPLPTVTATGQHIGLCEPFVLQQQSGGAPRSVDEPVPTVAAKGAIALVEPFLVTACHGDEGPGSRERRCHSTADPLPTVVGSNAFGLVEPFVISLEHSKGDPKPFICPTNHGSGDHRTFPVDSPMPTITTVDAWAVVDPVLVKFYGSGGEQSVDEPLGTITTKDRFGLVTTESGRYALDIRFRMLQPHELAAAQGFPADYKFAGTREQKVKQIGNAVPPDLGEALCAELIA